jgi:hypothetical protein
MSDNMNENKKQFRLSRLIVIIAIMLVIVGIVLGMYWGLDLDDKFKDQQSIKETLQAYGNLSRIMYVHPDIELSDDRRRRFPVRSLGERLPDLDRRHPGIAYGFRHRQALRPESRRMGRRRGEHAQAPGDICGQGEDRLDLDISVTAATG